MGSARRRSLFPFLIFFITLIHRRTNASPVAIEFLYPNFSASSVNYLETGGIFLNSVSLTFSAILSSDTPQSPFVFSIIHAPTSTVVWSANPTTPAPYTASLSLSGAGISISLSNGTLLWSTPTLPGPVSALQLLDSGNLLLLDAANRSLWQSFEHPTDTLLSSQRLPVGAYLSTPSGDYLLLVTAGDAVLVWQNGDQQYWRLSADPRSVKDLNDPVTYMADDDSGLSLFSAADKNVYFIHLPSTKLRIMKLESSGRFHIMGYSGNGSTLNDELVVPSGPCDLPLSCTELEVCTEQSISATCDCPSLFAASPGGGCSPADNSALASPSNCTGGEETSYLPLEGGIEYFSNKFASPANTGVNFSSCHSLCTGNCSCLGFFYNNSSRSCFLVKNKLGSLVNMSNPGVFYAGEGYIKTITSRQLKPDSGGKSNLIPILFSSITFLFILMPLLIAGTYWLYRRRHQPELSDKRAADKPAMLEDFLGRSSQSALTTREFRSTGDGSNSDESTDISIPGLPNRYTYAELVVATNNFSIKIGSGGFGEVFMGELPDKTAVAVKRIVAGTRNVQGKKEFCTEIAVIGRIHHVNLARLRGYCAERRRRLLVYEFMNRGSLDHSLFNAHGPVLEWGERMHIAVCAARGLAYLHSGCDHKIVHCDVKPENILLQDGGGVKIADFGLLKLMSPEQSGLFTMMRGTRGYLAPEWLTNSAISERTDVYSYGLVLLEIVRGKKNWMEAPGSSGGEWAGSGSSGVEGEKTYFPLVALEMHERGRYLELADPRLQGRITEEEVGRAVKVALCCLHEEPALRPPMATVAAMLDGSMEVARPRSEALGFVRLYGRGIGHGSGNGATGDGTQGTRSSSGSLPPYFSYLTSQEVSGPR